MGDEVDTGGGVVRRAYDTTLILDEYDGSPPHGRSYRCFGVLLCALGDPALQSCSLPLEIGVHNTLRG